MNFNPPLSALAGLMSLCLSVLLFGSCTATSPEYPLESQEPYSQQVPSDSWMDLARTAEARLDYGEAGLWLDRYATLPEAELDEDFWFHRAALAEKGGDPFRSAEVRAKLLETRPDDIWLRIDLADDYQQTGRDMEALDVLDHTFADPKEQAYALSAMVTLLLQGERKLDAALLCEQLGNLTTGRDAQEWWQRASSLHEQLGDLTRATICIERALDGVDLHEEEKRVVERLHAFELGQPENVADALMLLRHHINPDIRLEGIRYLARDRFPKDIGTFEFALNDPDVRVMRLALEQLAIRSQVGRTEAIAPLALHEDTQVATAALRALGVLGTAADMPSVLDAMTPENRSQFAAARSAAESITGHTIGVGLDPELEERRNLKLAWWTWWKEAPDGAKLGG
ncbi:MAG: HEAT repeat domain-containing protein [Planctomycetota bacterium]|nr:HEAT repeat domain-containing protein [Planctomycetota bacterium]MDA1114178.1 HEAT repeat domain-containing protein [Planctomycetota bacterium]